MRGVGLFILLLSPFMPVLSQEISLQGNWKFHIDDKPQWASPTFDDSKWESIFAPSSWEDEGFNGYDGFAWYRKKFDGRKLDQNQSYYLNLGFIDDTDEVYLNGVLVAFSGSMPPKFKTAYNNERKYPLPAELINFKGENTLAIRVFDTTNEGGIIDGKLGIFQMKKNEKLLIDLQGIWMFATSWNENIVKKESGWERVMVPSPWEKQGFAHYDGFAWYKRTFTLPGNYNNQPLVLLLGKIDDFDKTYLNGKLIGSTNDGGHYGHSHSYEKDRAYEIPPALLKKTGPNVIEILVDDMGNVGGIYEGTIGIATKANYLKYFKN